MVPNVDMMTDDSDDSAIIGFTWSTTAPIASSASRMTKHNMEL
jgi:hypothetical protein